MLEIRATNVPEEDGENPVLYGPYEWVEMTYLFVKVAPNGDDLLAFSPETGFWHPTVETPIPDSKWQQVGPDERSDRRFSDLTIAEVK